MKELLKKLALGIAGAAELLKTDNNAGIEKLAQIAKEIQDEAETIVDEPTAPTEPVAEPTSEPVEPTDPVVEPTASEDEGVVLTKAEYENLKKWAYLTIDAQDIANLIEQFNALKDSIVKKEDFDAVKTVVEKLSSEPISKTGEPGEIKKSSLGEALLPW